MDRRPVVRSRRLIARRAALRGASAAGLVALAVAAPAAQAVGAEALVPSGVTTTSSTRALASGHARRSAHATTPSVRRCPGTMSVNAGPRGGRQTARLRLVGAVSCTQARRLVRSWHHRMATGGCGKDNNFCLLDMPGGWVCSIFSAGESPLAGGANAGCARRSMRIRIYVTRAPN